MKKECNCEVCQNACRSRPGWFLPGEVEMVAEYLDISLQELFDKYLGIDWFMGEGVTEEIFLLAPALRHMEPGGMYPGDPSGACILFEDGKCKIHQTKPFECREYLHGESRSSIRSRRVGIVKAWKDHQQQIEKLYGGKPCSEQDDVPWVKFFNMF